MTRSMNYLKQLCHHSVLQGHLYVLTVASVVFFHAVATVKKAKGKLAEYDRDVFRQKQLQDRQQPFPSESIGSRQCQVGIRTNGESHLNEDSKTDLLSDIFWSHPGQILFGSPDGAEWEFEKRLISDSRAYLEEYDACQKYFMCNGTMYRISVKTGDKVVAADDHAYGEKTTGSRDPDVPTINRAEFAGQA
ncbi:hypothetical protein CPB85DRAFT_1256165 [Mucidula mucida]|nr:hypothetical protein CPB85DRAFT_1256165 [Mucidula mucida]